MSKDEVTVSITEITLTTGRKKNIRVTVDDKVVNIPVDEAVYAYFHEQFFRSNPTSLQSKRFATLMNMLRAAYKKGLSDGARS